MATPKPGEIRCPTCHRSTVPAAFCTQCGSAIPGGAVARPRGLDREELQERIRARRSSDDPYRRGGPAGAAGVAGGAAAGAGAYQPYRPEPEDAAARASDQAVEPPRIDNYREAPARGEAVAEPPPYAPLPDQRSYDKPDDEPVVEPVVEPPPYVPPRSEAAAAAPRIDNYDDDSYELDEDLYPYADDDEPRGPGAGPIAILAILAIGVLALLGGAFLGGFLGGDEDGVGSNLSSPTPSVLASPVETPAASTTPLPGASQSGPANASGQPSEGPRVFPDGFVAEAQPCATEPTSPDCGSSGAVNSGTVYILVSFRNGTAADVIGVNVVSEDGAPVGGGDIELRQINCTASCAGWTYFRFVDLEAGEYTVNVTRNGEPANSTGFRSEP